MNVKDYWRILLRRWFPFTVTFFIFFIPLLWWAFLDPVYFTAETKVLIESPKSIQVFESSSERLLPRSAEVDTWVELIRERGVRDMVKDHFDKADADTFELLKAGGWLTRVRTARHQQTLLTTIIAEGPDQASAIKLANAYARAAQQYSENIANRDLIAGRENAQQLLSEKQGRIDALRRELEEAYSAVGADSLPSEVERLNTEYRRTVGRIQTIDRTSQANITRVARLREDRLKVASLHSQPVPRSDQRTQMLASIHPDLAELRGRIDETRRQLSAARENYTSIHPKIEEMEKAIRDLQLLLTERTIRALQNSFDRDEVRLLTENELLEIERDLLLTHHDELSDRLSKLSPLLTDYRQKEDVIEQEKKIRDEMASIIGRISGVNRVNGYVTYLEDQKAESAFMTQPRSRQFVILAFLIAILMGAAAAYLTEQLDTNLRSDYDVKRHLNLPVLSVVPKIKPEEDRLLVRSAKETVLSEEFDKLITMIMSMTDDAPLRAITVVSPNPEEGKSTMSLNTATAAARQGKRVLLVDADMRKPQVHNMLGLQNDVGFSGLLADSLNEEERGRLYQDSGVENLTVITSGGSAENPYQLLDPSNLRPVLDQLKNDFDLVVLDTPPLLSTSDGIKLAAMSDASLMIIGADGTDHRQGQWAKHLLENVKAKILGVLLNKAIRGGEQYYYYYHYYAERKSVRG